MIVLAKTPEANDVRLTRHEMWMLHGALNETCNGVQIGDWEFQTRLGYEREPMTDLLDQIGDAAKISE
jgi:hypothetical protein